MSNSGVTAIAARADLCRLLAACYYQPGPEFAEEKVFESMRVAATGAEPSFVPLVAALGAAFDATPMEALQVDHTALFLSPNGARALPYESVWIAGADAMRSQEASHAVVRFYQDAGFEVDDDFRDLPDHIAAELEFLYALIFREARARANAQPVDERASRDWRRRFVAEHLGQWAPAFAGAMQSEAQTDFYRTLAKLTYAFVRAEAEQTTA